MASLRMREQQTERITLTQLKEEAGEHRHEICACLYAGLRDVGEGQHITTLVVPILYAQTCNVIAPFE